VAKQSLVALTTPSIQTYELFRYTQLDPFMSKKNGWSVIIIYIRDTSLNPSLSILAEFQVRVDVR
jgi:hypothetical protein